MGGTSCQHRVLWASLTKLIRMGQTGWGEGQKGWVQVSPVWGGGSERDYRGWTFHL